MQRQSHGCLFYESKKADFATDFFYRIDIESYFCYFVNPRFRYYLVLLWELLAKVRASQGGLEFSMSHSIAVYSPVVSVSSCVQGFPGKHKLITVLFDS